ncbi:thiol:disulfide interchange protein DsbA [Massilia terrae]|uniref:Thiol:disulfide interchange protein n=1 Tax=Massilia terrae TaxID=1811224 RepID=A0ABT2CYS6_9BURK|nr:thiol:disulfide interchange protein DsbA/DsbL [Massilia terrae]MCS0659122.1 thiol:disulfide interchange protein DsbA/DsbL [Massilia terrae]
MRVLRLAIVAASLVVSTAFASPTDPKQGVEYTVLAQPQPSATVGKKIEVIEFFMYHCPHCQALEPTLEQWVKKQDGNIIFKRVHMPYQGASDPEAHLFLTLSAMGKNEELQSKAMAGVKEIVMRDRNVSDKAILDWAAKQPSLDKAKFTDTWNSFGVMTKLRRLNAIVSQDYKVDSVPTIIVDGKYVTSPAQVGGSVKASSEQELFQATLQVVDALIAKAQKSK